MGLFPPGFPTEKTTKSFHQSFQHHLEVFDLLPIAMSAPGSFLAQEKFWANKAECEDAEYRYYAKLHGKAPAEPAPTAADDDIDLFGSSDENESATPAAKPVVQLKKVEKSKMQQKAEAHAAKQAAAKKAASQPKPAKEEVQ